jgi:CubicO group peptidase (beta-lactamase class C family)
MSKRCEFLTLCIVALLFAGACRASATMPRPEGHTEGLDPAVYPLIDALIQEVIDKGHAPGAVVLIGRGQKTLMRKAYGHRLTGPEPEPMTANTLFDLASLTKATATATAIMLLVQDGELALDDPVAKHLPGFEQHGKGDITIHHLLTHTSGLKPYESVAAIAKVHGPGPHPDGLIEHLCGLEKSYETGKRYRYSCLNYLLLARVAQNLLGDNMEAFLEKRLWQPLGMRDTTYFPEGERLARTAPTIRYTDTSIRRGRVHDPLAFYSADRTYAPGNAGVFSTVDDMQRYVRMLLSGGRLAGKRIFEKEILERITTDQVDEIAGCHRTCGWGVWSEKCYATSKNQTPQTCCLGHTGYTGTIVWMDKLSGTYVILFTNCVYPQDEKSHKDAVVAMRRRVISLVLDHLDIYEAERR